MGRADRWGKWHRAAEGLPPSLPYFRSKSIRLTEQGVLIQLLKPLARAMLPPFLPTCHLFPGPFPLLRAPRCPQLPWGLSAWGVRGRNNPQQEMPSSTASRACVFAACFTSGQNFRCNRQREKHLKAERKATASSQPRLAPSPVFSPTGVPVPLPHHKLSFLGHTLGGPVPVGHGRMASGTEVWCPVCQDTQASEANGQLPEGLQNPGCRIQRAETWREMHQGLSVKPEMDKSSPERWTHAVPSRGPERDGGTKGEGAVLQACWLDHDSTIRHRRWPRLCFNGGSGAITLKTGCHSRTPPEPDPGASQYGNVQLSSLRLTAVIPPLVLA